MIGRKYHSFYYHHFKSKKKKKRKIGFPKLAVMGLAFIIILFISIRIFLNTPLMSLGLDRKREDKKIQASGIMQSGIANEIHPKLSVSSESTIQEKSNQNNVIPSTGKNKDHELRGLTQISQELDRLNLQNNTFDKEELELSYQREDQKEYSSISGCLESGETLYQYLVQHDISPAEILRLQEKLESVVDLNYLKAGTKFSVHHNSEGKIVQFDYQPNQLDAYHIRIPLSEMEQIEVTKDEIYQEIVCFEGEIETSLYQAMMDYCQSCQLAIQIAEIFAWDIDFLTECRSGDQFKILVEKQYRGDFYRWGDILAAVYEGEMLSTHTAILFEDPSGHQDYYDTEGQCLRKAFLKAPLHYKYISSHYSKNRFHPILRIWRPHLAIDYAAPTGTPIVTIGSGTVMSKYYDKGGYGNYVRIRHPNGYTTGYGHLSKFANGLQKGDHVEQGEIIGYVGATGLATGPHLDFSISKNGQRINFLELELPPAMSVEQKYQEDFEAVKKNYLSILEEDQTDLRSSNQS